MARIALTQQEFEDKVKISAPNLIIKGKYVNTRTPIAVQCRECGYEWKPRASILLDGNEKNYICPYCNQNAKLHKCDLYNLLDKESTEIFPLFLKEYDEEVIKSKDDILIYDSRCKHYWNTTYNRIQKQGIKCPYCSNNKVWRGYNDIATTDPWMIELMKDKNNAYKYTRGSYQKIDWCCKICGKEYHKIIHDVWEHGLACTTCSDGRKYPEKFFAHLLDELNINFISQYSINGYPYMYDFYLPNYNCIIETHGKQHYDKHGFGMIHEGGRTLEEEKENDRIKEELAKKLGYNYIIIDCRKSNYQYIKNSILKTEFCNLTHKDLNSIDFVKIHIKSLSSNYLTACELFNKKIDIQSICEYLHLSYDTIIKYLKDGTQNGLCNYDTEAKMKKILKQNQEKNKKMVRCKTNQKIFNSLKEASEYYGFSASLLSRHLCYPEKCKYCGYDKKTKEKLIWEFV